MHPDATIRYHASDMILQIHSDASYPRSQMHEAASEVCFSWATNPPNKISAMDPSLISLPSSRVWSPPPSSQKLERAFITPKVAPHSESHSLN
jgi:hypothetical protein